MEQKNGCPETHEDRVERKMQLLYAKKTQERRVFLDDLTNYRRQTDKKLFQKIKKIVGPKWYHSLSVPQRNSLDTLEFSIYQDLLENRPTRTAKIMKQLGIFPRPNETDLMNCIHLGRNDPKEMLAQLFQVIYGHPMEGKRTTYCLNGRLLLSGILYLGLHNLIQLLRERFRPDPESIQPRIKTKPTIEPPLASPYLQKMVAALYEPPGLKRYQPQPLPNLDDLNEPYEEDPPMPKPPPPPPPPPPPKKRLPRSYCDQIAGIVNIGPKTSMTALAQARMTHRKVRGAKLSVTEMKKTYGMNIGASLKKTNRRRKPVAPTTGIWNAQYTINGVYKINGKTVYVLGNVSILPPCGDLIHGGYSNLNGQNINIHCGFRGRAPPPKPDPCDCVKKWQNSVFQYIRTTKCYCGHHYDFGNEGTFLPDELPFFQKPTNKSPFSFNYETIYDIDPKRLHIKKEFRQIWNTDSILHVDDGTVQDKKDKKKKKKRSSTTCLGKNPRPEDYLQCALRLMRRVNIAAKLPDIHLVPELKEWMRRRIYGPHSERAKAEMLRESTTYWTFFQMLSHKGFGHKTPPEDPKYSGHTTWRHKQNLNDNFKKFSMKYKLDLFRSYAYVNNLMWPSMFQAQFPDKKFREIFFSYLFARMEDLQLMHPYSSRESTERMLTIGKKRYICMPSGVENLE